MSTKKFTKDSENSDDNSEELIENLDELIENLESILMDKYSLSIIAELFVNLELTAKELEEKKTIEMKKSLLYAKLKSLEDDGIIVRKKQSNKDGKKERGYTPKVYAMNYDRFIELSSAMMKFQERPELQREVRLIYLYLLQTFFNREISFILNTSQSEFKKFTDTFKFKEKHYNYGSIQFVNEELFEWYQEKLLVVNTELTNKMNEIAEKKKNKDDSPPKINPYLIYHGFLYLQELDNQNKTGDK